MANYNPRHAKINRCYLAEEIAERFGVHKNTVMNWFKQGLKDCGAGRPRLVLGKDLRDFLEQKRRKNKRPCKPGEIYCVGCRCPTLPIHKIAHLVVSESGRAEIIGRCPSCQSKIFRKVSLAKKDAWKGDLVLLNTQG